MTSQQGARALGGAAGAAGDARLVNKDLAPTPKEARTWNTWHIAALWIGMSVCIPTYMLASNLIAQGWPLAMAVASVALGNLVVLVPMVLNAHPGTKYGIPFPVLLRASFGVLGANVPAMLRALVACGWFGIQTWIGGMAIYTLCSVLLPRDLTLPQFLPDFIGISTGQLLAFLAFWALNVAIIVRGISTIKVLETWSAPFLLAIGAALFVWALGKVGSLGAMLADPESAGEASATASGISLDMLAVGLTSGVSFWGTLALNIPDFARFARSQRDQLVGQALGLPTTMTAFAFIGAAVTNATAVIFGDRIADPVALLAMIGGPALTILAMLGLTVATLTTNLAANVVSPANDISNLAPHKISFRKGALIAATIGIAIMPWKLLASAAAFIFAWLVGYGGLLGAVGGIMIVDYFVIRGRELDLEDLYRRGGRYEYTKGFNPIALVALAAGILPNVPGFLAALGVMDAGRFFAAVYQWSWFVAFFLAGLVYWVGMALFSPRPGPGQSPSAS